MQVRIESWRERARSSLWVWPAAAALLAIALARLLPWIDRTFIHERAPWTLFTGPPGARALLGTIASSMINLTALVFSVTLLVLQLASAQYSPRLIRTFLHARTTKLTLAGFVGTFVYALLVLLELGTDDVRVPTLSVLVAFGLVLVSVGVFIKYIDTMAHAVRVIDLITRVARETRSRIDAVFPEPLQDAEAVSPPLPDRPADIVVTHTGQPGVITNLDESALVAHARELDGVVALVPRVGAFVPRGAPLLHVWAPTAGDLHKLRSTIGLDEERTLEQDAAFGFRQLVDIALRALSPGINDPTTATQALDHLHDFVRRLCGRRMGDIVHFDDEGRLRFLAVRDDFEAYVMLAFEEIAYAARGSLQVTRRLRAALEDCLTIAPDFRRAPLARLLERVREPSW